MEFSINKSHLISLIIGLVIGFFINYLFERDGRELDLEAGFGTSSFKLKIKGDETVENLIEKYSSGKEENKNIFLKWVKEKYNLDLIEHKEASIESLDNKDPIESPSSYFDRLIRSIMKEPKTVNVGRARGSDSPREGFARLNGFDPEYNNKYISLSSSIGEVAVKADGLLFRSNNPELGYDIQLNKEDYKRLFGERTSRNPSAQLLLLEACNPKALLDSLKKFLENEGNDSKSR